MSIFQRLNPSLVPTSPKERLRASLGALTGICLTGLVSTAALAPGASLPLLVAPMGASAVLLFAAPASPFAQPWSILGGNIVAALIGVTCARFVPDPLIAASLAVSLAIGVMLVMNCLHPPSGAVALTAVMGGAAVHHAGYWFVLTPVAINSAIILSVALVFNNVTGHRYPHRVPKPGQPGLGTKDPLPGHRLGAGLSDIKAVIEELDEVVDISPDELDDLFHKAQIRAFGRHKGAVASGHVMSRDVLSVTTGTSLRAVWRIFMARHVKALPVIDTDGRLAGIVTTGDFLANSVLSDNGMLRLGFGQRIVASIRGRRVPAVVDDVMQKKVHSALPETPISALIFPMVDLGLDQVPVVDGKNRLVGIVSQSDVLGALVEREFERSEAV